MTNRRTLRVGPPGAGGYRQLVRGPGETHRTRTDLCPAPAWPGRALVTLAHLSDLHVCDAQSPARAEFLDRWADPDSPVREVLDEVGTYRAQEILTAQVAEAMVQAINAVDAGPVGGAPLQLAIATGDNVDNAQANELAWYLALLEGGTVAPDSGDRRRYEGVADGELFDERFWHPETARPDLARNRYGFPYVPGLLDAVRAPFPAAGLRLPWLAVHGNHDRMLQGTVPALGPLAAAAVGALKPIGLAPQLSVDAIVKLIEGLADCDPSALAILDDAELRPVTADPDRRIISRAEFVAAHFGPSARPPGHGFGPEHQPYYRFDTEAVTVLVLDTVDQYGGWEGSLDVEQLAWLQAELATADAERRYVVLASHHPLARLVNDRTDHAVGRRVLAEELAAVLVEHPSVVLWLNGHTHQTTITPHGSWWEVTAPSLIDWPQQARLVELLRGDGVLTVATTMVDHAGLAPWDGAIDEPLALAGLARELAANDWQWRHTELEQHRRSGKRRERNALLYLPDPWG
jgi:metallophosphoesterase (TIGR03767 family)